MLLTLSTTHELATDLGFLHKKPAKLQAFDLTFGHTQVYYPEATPQRCTAALLLEIDPVGLVRGRGPAGEESALKQCVNDRPHVASSFLLRFGFWYRRWRQDVSCRGTDHAAAHR